MQRYLPTLIDHIDRLRAAPDKVITPEQITLLEEPADDLVQRDRENSDEPEGMVESVTEEVITGLNEELIEADTPELIANGEVVEEAAAETA
jgi:hypothetical protein